MNTIILSPSKKKMLLEAIRTGIINFDSVYDDLIVSKIENVKKMHPYRITPPSHAGCRWSTYYKGADGKRHNIKAQTEESLYKKLVSVYYTEQNLDKKTFKELFDEWIDYKESISNSMNTIKRHKQRYRKYFEPVFANVPIRRIQEVFLEVECNKLVADYNMSSKEWINAKTILNGMFSYAIRMGYLEKSPLENVVISKRFRQIAHKTGKTETYNSEELRALSLYLDEMYSKTFDTVYLAVKLNFYLGLRVGELVALKWTDRTDLNHLHIQREEVRNQETGEISIEEHTKTNTDRYVPLVPKAINILAKISNNSEYIFTKGDKRIKARQVNYVLEKYAERKGLKTKSSHKIRKTFASNLNASGIPIDSIREILGHANLSTTYNYIFNPLTEQETYNLIVKAL